MSENPMSVELLVTTYKQIGTLTAQRADIDSKLLILHSKVGQIVACASVNAPVAVPPAEGVSENTTTPPKKPAAKKVTVKKEVKKEVEKEETKVVDGADGADGAEPLQMSEVNELVQGLVQKAGPTAMAFMTAENWGTYGAMDDAKKIAFVARLNEEIANNG